MPNPEYAYDASRTNYDTMGSLPKPTHFQLFEAYYVNSPGCSSLAHAAIRNSGVDVDTCPPAENEIAVLMDTRAAWNEYLDAREHAENRGQI